MNFRSIPVGEARELPFEEGWREWDRAVKRWYGESAGEPPRWLTQDNVPPPRPLFLEPLATAGARWLDTVDKAYL